MKTLALPLLAALALASCQKTTERYDAPSTSPQLIDNGGLAIPPCDSFVICTADFRMVTLRILRPDSSAALLDSFHVTDAAGVKLAPVNGVAPYGPLLSSPQLPPEGRYAVVTDAWVSGHQQTQTTVYAKGWRNGALVMNEMFGIGADCCHVFKYGGPAIVIIPN